MASLIVNNVISSSVQITYEYLGTEELFGYTVRGNYVVNISDINIQQNDTVLLSGRDAIKDAYGKANIVARIGADSYLNGRIQSFDFNESSLVGSEEVTLNIEESRKLDDYSQRTYGRYAPDPHQISSFTESYTFSRSGSDYSSTRNVDLAYKQSAGNQFLNNAKAFLTNYYFAFRPSYGYQQDGISENAKISEGFRGDIVETYDLITLSVSLSETINTSFIDELYGVSRQSTENIQITEQGFLEKSCQVELKSLRSDSESSLLHAISKIVNQIKDKEQSVYGNPISISKGLTKDGYSASLTVSFSTDPKKSQDDSVSYSGSEKKAGKFKEYSLSIQYSSKGKNNKDKFSNAKAAWVTGQQLNPSRIKRLFHPLEDFFEKSRSTTFQQSEGKISENIVFTTDDSYKERDDGLLKLKKTLSKTHQIKRLEKFHEIGSLEDQVVQNTLKTVGQASVTASAVASQSMGIYKAKESLESDEVTAEFNELVDEDVIHITSDEISLNLGEGTASRTVNYLFHKNG
jgi:hypothetical protein